MGPTQAWAVAAFVLFNLHGLIMGALVVLGRPVATGEWLAATLVLAFALACHAAGVTALVWGVRQGQGG